MSTLRQRIALILESVLRPVLETRLAGYDPGLGPRFNERGTEYAFVFRHISQLRQGKLLDVGSGRSAFPALALLAGWDVVAVDNVKDFWEAGRLAQQGLFNPHFHVKQRDVADLGFESEFDVVTCISTFEHVLDRPAVFRAMARSLKHGGVLLITGPYREMGGCENVYEHPESDAFENPPPYRCTVMDSRELGHLAQVNALKIVDIEFWRFYSGRFWSEGQPISPPEPSARREPHQIACIALMKDSDIPTPGN